MVELLDGVRELVLGECADLRLHHVEHGRLARLSQGGPRDVRLSEKPRQRPHKAIVGILIVRLAAMSRHAFHSELQPDDLLFGDRDAVDELAGRKQIAAAEAAFVEDVLRVQLGIVIRDHPPRAERATHFLVRFGQQNDVARQRDPFALQAQERKQLRDALPLHVHRASGPQFVAPDGRFERIGLPLRSVRRHHVHVVHQQNRLAGRRRHRGFQTRVDNRLPRCRFVPRDRDALALQDGGEEVRRLSGVARRVRCIDAHIVAEQAHGFVLRLPRHLTRTQRKQRTQRPHKPQRLANAAMCAEVSARRCVIPLCPLFFSFVSLSWCFLEHTGLTVFPDTDPRGSTARSSR